jgi:hypothetical protein
MGNAQADCFTYLNSDIQADVSSSCSGSAIIENKDITVNIGEIDCGDVSIGNNTINQLVNCDNDTTVQAFSQAVINSSTEADSGLLSFLSGGASAEDSVNVAQNIASHVQSRCSTSSEIKNTDEVFTVGKVTGRTCNILNNTIDQRFSCINQTLEELTTTANITQSATASTGINMTALIEICVVIVVACVVIKIVTSFGGKKKTAPKLTTKEQLSKLTEREALDKGRLEGLLRTAKTLGIDTSSYTAP